MRCAGREGKDCPEAAGAPQSPEWRAAPRFGIIVDMDMIAFAALSRHIMPGERLLWAGRPEPVAYARSRGGSLAWVGVSLLVAGIVIEGFGLEVALTRAVALDPILVALTGLPFLAIGLLLAAEPWRAYRRAKVTVYGLTSERAIILQLKPERHIRTLPRSAIRAILRRHTSGDTVDITFYARAKAAGTEPPVDGFHAIRDGAMVEKLAMKRESESA